jgi:hypothetical protein
MNKKVSLAVAFAAVVIFISGSSVFGASEKVLFGTDSGCDCLYIIDRATGDTIHVGDLGASGEFETPTSMAVDLNGTLFSVNNSTGELITLDRGEGTAVVVGSGLGEVGGLAITPVDLTSHPKGTLFGVLSGNLIVIDKTTGDYDVIGSIGFSIVGLVFRDDGTLFGADGLNNKLVIIDTETGEGEALGTIGPNVDQIGSLTFTPDERLLGSDFGSYGERIFEINQCTGTISDVLIVESAPQGMDFAFRVINLEDPDPEDLSQFGFSVSGGASVIVGAPFSDLAPDAGQAFVFTGRDLRNVITLSDPEPEEDAQFGYSVSGGASVIVGAPFSDLAPDAGQAFVFTGEDYGTVITLEDPEPERSALFGYAVSGGASVIVGAPFSDLAPDAGQAFVFTGEDYGTVITLEDPEPERKALFGFSVSGGASVIVGAPFSDLAPDAGQAFVFTGENYEDVTTLQDPDPEKGARFGWSVSGGASVIVGAPFSDLEKDAGQVFVFKGDGYEIVITLNPPDPEKGALFGYDVSAVDFNSDGNPDVAVGAPFADVYFNGELVEDAGKIYIFLGPDYSEVIILTAPFPQEGANYGLSVSGDVDGLIAGIPNLDVDEAEDVGKVVFYETGIPPMPVALDIKPQSCPNPFNTSDNGVIKMAILGTSSFDVHDIVIESIRLEGVPPTMHSFEDKATPQPGECTDCTVKGHDGYVDLRLTYNVQDIVCALGEVEDKDYKCLTITGNLRDGTRIEGSDAVTILTQEPGPQSKGPSANLPAVFSLHQNVPNPFSSTTTIRYALPIDSNVSLKIYDITGRVVRTLVDGEQKAQYYTINWDGRANTGEKAASGIYFTRMVAGKFVATQKTVLLK